MADNILLPKAKDFFTLRTDEVDDLHYPVMKLDVGADGSSSLLGRDNAMPSSLVDYASGHDQHVSHFGVAKSGPTIPVFRANFPGTTLDATNWDSVPINSATVTVANGMAELDCGTNSAGSVKVKSRQQGLFVAGQVTVFQSGVRAGTGLASNTRIWGLMDEDEQEGLYFKWDGTTFQVVARKAGVETTVDSANFSDHDWTPTDANTTYRIEYSAGRALFYRASGGHKALLHEMVDTQAPLVNDLSIGAYYENTNTGNTTSVSLYVRGSSASVWGSLNRHNKAGALITQDYDFEVALKRVDKTSLTVKYGRNGDIDASQTEDVWGGGGDYTGFDATANENLRVVSSSATDAGTVESSGTVTGTHTTRLIDSSATFSTDGVTVGDLVINDTQAIHGIVTSVDSETQLTVFSMVSDDPLLAYRNKVGDAYRVVSPSSTGCAVVRFTKILNADYEDQGSVYVVLNGTTNVDTTIDCMRCSRAQCILGDNAGTITFNQATTTANVFGVMPVGNGQTAIAADTVPAGKVALVENIEMEIVRANGSAGSATGSFRVRRYGESFRSALYFELQTGANVQQSGLGIGVLPAGTDFKLRCEDVSDNNTVASGRMAIY